MNSQIENDLRQYHGQFTQEHNRLREEILTRLPLVNQLSQPIKNVRKKRLLRSFLGVAACMAAALSIWFAFFSGPQTLSAQVLEAFKKAQSVHLIRKIWKDGTWTPGGEVWYQNGHGVREEMPRRDQKIIRIDNGTYQWRYDSDTNLVVRLKSSDPLGLAAEAINSGKTLNRCKLDPSGDTTIQGRPCHLLTAMNDQQTVRTLVWMDKDSRLLRYKEQIFKEGKWIEDEWIEAEYDLPVDIALFQPNFGDNVKIVESDKFLDQHFNIHKAIFVKEFEGHILALHQLRRINDRAVFIVYSTRPTEEILRKFGLPQGSLNYADFHLYKPGKRVGIDKWQNYQAVDLATFYQEGMVIKWALVLLQGEWPEKIDAFDFSGRFYSRGPIQEERKKANKPAYQDFQPLATLPLPTETMSLDEVIASVYQETSLCQPFAFQLSLQLQSQRLSENEIQEQIKLGMPEQEARKLFRRLASPPNKISQEAFGQAIKEYIAELKKMGKAEN
jgi:outer membrane lipoprotein-sorting protein